MAGNDSKPSRRGSGPFTRRWLVVAVIVVLAIASFLRTSVWLLLGLLLLMVLVLPPLMRRIFYSVGARLRLLYVLTGFIPGLMLVIVAYYGAHAVLGQVGVAVVERRLDRWALDSEHRLARGTAAYWRARAEGADRREALRQTLAAAERGGPGAGRTRTWVTRPGGGPIASIGGAPRTTYTTPTWLGGRSFSGVVRLPSGEVEIRAHVRIDDAGQAVDLWRAVPLDATALNGAPPPWEGEMEPESVPDTAGADQPDVRADEELPERIERETVRAGQRGLRWLEGRADKVARESEIVAYHDTASALLVTVFPWRMTPGPHGSTVAWLTPWGPEIAPSWGLRATDRRAIQAPAAYTRARAGIRSALPVLTWTNRTSATLWDSGRAVDDVLLFLAFSIESTVFALFGAGLPPVVWVTLLIALVILGVLQSIAENNGFRFARRIAEAIGDLERGVKAIRAGRFGHQVAPRGEDQLGTLAHGFNEMSQQLGELVEERSARQALERELEIARRVQARLFPSAEPRSSHLQVRGVCSPARTVSGDYYDFIEVGDGLDVVVADVSGKGVGAAFLMANVHAVLRSLYPSNPGDPIPDPADLLGRLNRHLARHAEESRFVTLCLLRYLGGGELRYANGGHNPPALLRGGSVTWLSEGGPLLGPFPDARYETARAEVRAGDVVVLYTDGVVEAESPGREQFGEARLVALLEKLSGRGAAGIQAGVFEALERWRGDAEVKDDVTLVVIEIRD